MTKHDLEGSAVQEQPAFDMRVRNRMNDRCRRVLGCDLPDSLAKALTVGVGSDDNQIRLPAALLPQVTRISLKFSCDPAVAASRTEPSLTDLDATLLGDSRHQSADHDLVPVIFAEQSDFIHRSRL